MIINDIIHYSNIDILLNDRNNYYNNDKNTPTGGLEPPTTRLRVWRSTD